MILLITACFLRMSVWNASWLLMPYTLGTSVKAQSSLTIILDNYNNMHDINNNYGLHRRTKHSLHVYMHMTVSAI